jgi:hypothetical protein
VPHIHPRLLLELSQVPEDQWIPVAYGPGWEKGWWDEASIGNFEALDLKAKRRAVKGGGQTPPTPSPEKPRGRRESIARKKRRENRGIIPGARYAPRRSMNPTLDHRLPSGAVRTLDAIICLSKGKKLWKGCTNWLARYRGCTVRTIQYHYKQLEAAEYIYHLGVDRNHQTTIALRPAVEPPPFKPKKPETPNPAPQPQPAAKAEPRPQPQPEPRPIEPSKKPEATSPIPQAAPAKKISPIQTIKVRISEGYAEPHPAIENRKLEPREPGAEPPRPARPPSPALDGAGEAEPLRFSKESWLARRPGGAAEGQQAEPTEVDLKLAEILNRVLDHARGPEKEALRDEEGWDPGGGSRDQDPEDETVWPEE